MEGSSSIDLSSSLKPGWIHTNKRGRPGNKRKLEMFLIENPNGGHEEHQKIEESDTISSTDDPPAYTEKRKPSGSWRKRGRACLCCCCYEDINSKKALGGHVEYEEKMALWKLVPPEEEENGWKKPERLQEALQLKADCPWCNKSFVNRFAVAAHTRFCREKDEQMAMTMERMMPAAPGLKFDLNRSPAEASVLPNAVVLRW